MSFRRDDSGELAQPEPRTPAEYPVLCEPCKPGEVAYYAFHARQPGGNGDMYCPQATPWCELTDHERETWAHVAEQVHEASLAVWPTREVLPDEIDEDPLQDDDAIRTALNALGAAQVCLEHGRERLEDGAPGFIAPPTAAI